MKQLLILSGKGGTGKTTVAGAFIRLAGAKAFADCDVDAPNLHLIMNRWKEPELKDYCGLPKAEIDHKLCTLCDLCRENCRFDAITLTDSYQVDSFACEGCGLCAAICPAEAITLKPAVAGELILYRSPDSVFSTAQLLMGSGTTGLLVTEVKKQLRAAAGEVELAVIDGSPGIGCPVIASLNGADLVLIVAEPSVSGISDMERIIQTAEIFNMQIAVCINKFDTNLENTALIECYCAENDLPFCGKIPFDPEAVRAINSGKTIVDLECPSGTAVKYVYHRTMELLLNESGSRPT
jgi:MinD superfamily P-loop ATPase